MVVQDRFGEVLNVQMKQCNGSDAFKSTVERAVRKASPLPEAPNNDVFDRKIEFSFRPDI
jgi:colicin import membrane protein